MGRLLGLLALALLLAGAAPAAAQEYLGQWSANGRAEDSTANRAGRYGSAVGESSINNRTGRYGSPAGDSSAANPYATDAPKLYDRRGNYRGRLSANPYDPESVANPVGRYGGPYSEDSVTNPYGAGSPYESESPANPTGRGLTILGR